MAKIKTLLTACCLLALTGCSLAPDYARPTMDIPAEWTASQQQALQLKWWERFGDKTLNALVEEALDHNRNIAVMMANVDQAQAGLGIARDAMLPVPAASADGTRVMARDAMSPTALRNGGKNTHAFTGALAASWTLDFWGKYWNAAESARHSLLATEAARDNVILTVQAAVVESYFWLSAYTWQEDICASVLASRESELKLYQNRFDNGQISDLDILSIKANVETARQALANARIAKNAAESSLAVLLGRSPAEVMKTLGVKAPAALMRPLPTTPVLPAGLPSEILERRPDIRQAEENLMAANCDIGVARASYFPSFSITGLLGSASVDLDQLLRASKAMGALPAAGAPPPTSGRTSAP
ncbi:MAG: efflux transporter outer membrane subunit [Mailhella sp.]|nr:efflux transporter outer membrane subunit [Mailhella sp.]